jgi:hypothetical protein
MKLWCSNTKRIIPKSPNWLTNLREITSKRWLKITWWVISFTSYAKNVSNQEGLAHPQMKKIQASLKLWLIFWNATTTPCFKSTNSTDSATKFLKSQLSIRRHCTWRSKLKTTTWLTSFTATSASQRTINKKMPFSRRSCKARSS